MIETLRSAKTPWDVFRSVYADSKTCFFLDTPRYQSSSQAYSYIGMAPSTEVFLGRKRLRVRGKINEAYPAEKFFSVLKKILKEHQTRFGKDLPFFTGGLVGYLGYEAADLCDKIKLRRKPAPTVPRAYFGLFCDVIAFDHQKKIYHLITQTSDPGKLKTYFEEPIPENQLFQFKKIVPEMTKRRFKAMVEKAKEYIAAGDIYQANLSQRFSFRYGGSSLELYGNLRKINPSPFSCFFKMGNLEIISSSPERLIHKKGDCCQTRPIAGTCKAYGSRRQLEIWKRQLLRSEKERAEHLMLVDLERNDLGRVCHYRSVKVEEFMALEKYSHVIHLVSKITGKIKKEKTAFDLIKAMFPGGTITGCPKIRCMEIIDELEPVQRGIYTGSLGYIQWNGDLDLNIIIRTMILQKNKGWLQVGAGIVYDSDPEKEYEETLHKAKALIKALTFANTGGECGP